jgi:ketosteroid isomerase-like protein
MSRENVEIVRRLIEAWNRNEQESVVPLERVVPFLDPGVIFDATRRIINPKTYAGIEGIRAMLAERDEVWGQFRMEPDEFVDAGDHVVAIGRWVGKGSGSGVEVNQPIADVFTLHGGRVVRCEIGYSDRAEALDAAGLSQAMSRGGSAGARERR